MIALRRVRLGSAFTKLQMAFVQNAAYRVAERNGNWTTMLGSEMAVRIERAIYKSSVRPATKLKLLLRIRPMLALVGLRPDISA